MNIKIAKFKNGAKGAFSFVFDDGCYLPSSQKVIDIFKETEKTHGVKLIATSAQTVSFLKEENVIFWKRPSRTAGLTWLPILWSTRLLTTREFLMRKEASTLTSRKSDSRRSTRVWR